METHSNKESSYRQINVSLLTGRGSCPFDIFYKTESFGSQKFVKFASTQSDHHDKVKKMMEEGETEEEFYIRDEDLFHYYEEATQSLRKMVSDPNVPFEKKSKKIYNVSKEIMMEFFDNNASTKILRSSESVMEVMEDCLSNAEAGFYGISQITNKDYYTYTHSVNVGLYCMTFGIKTGMSQNDVRDLGLGGMLHDVGKSKVDYEIINKKGRLTDEEFEEVKKHTFFGMEILSSMGCYGKKVICMAEAHHEQFGGGGYPRGIAKDEIDLHARICKIMDVYDAVTTKRSYKKALDPFNTILTMKKEMSHHFDPGLLESFIILMGPEQ